MDTVVASFEERYRAVHSLASDFTQENFIASLEESRAFQGKLFLARPSLFAMEVFSPSRQTLIFDGHFFWVYTEASNQVLKHTVAQSFFDHPLISLLTTMENLQENFTVSLAPSEAATVDQVLMLTPKKSTGEVQTIHLRVSKETSQIKEVTLYHGSGNYTRLALNNTVENGELPPERFQYSPAPGTDVVEDPTPVLKPY
ncbi:MAG: outer membrane lipoprotein chaperone LolA [Deltaproteobacteria bacterium]|nr:outer membrane lipoprotein chaperone LolA [Deltaproteobacteria bacterium]